MRNRLGGEAMFYGIFPMVSEPGLLDRLSDEYAPCGCVGRWRLVVRMWQFVERGPAWEHTTFVTTPVWQFVVVTSQRHGKNCAGVAWDSAVK